VFGRMEVLGRMAIDRAVAAADVAAGQTQAQVDPRIGMSSRKGFWCAGGRARSRSPPLARRAAGPVTRACRAQWHIEAALLTRSGVRARCLRPCRALSRQFRLNSAWHSSCSSALIAATVSVEQRE
jgi:hypothetical protein